ncbi:hypothetical protein GBA52_024391 [Prunus armeniaca]|nr:hypothetical protein GBA52_024391 [Prunus armeniaca]
MQHISPLCPFCQSLPETIQHLFMDCQFAKDVWALSTDLMPLPSQIGGLYNWLMSLSTTTIKSDLDPLSKALLICWQIGGARNNVVFHDSKATPASCIHAAACVGLDFWRLNSMTRCGSADSMIIKWHPPPIGWIKVNFDGALMNSHAPQVLSFRIMRGMSSLRPLTILVKIPLMLLNVLLFEMVLPLLLIEDGIKL